MYGAFGVLKFLKEDWRMIKWYFVACATSFLLVVCAQVFGFESMIKLVSIGMLILIATQLRHMWIHGRSPFGRIVSAALCCTVYWIAGFIFAGGVSESLAGLGIVAIFVDAPVPIVTICLMAWLWGKLYGGAWHGRLRVFVWIHISGIKLNVYEEAGEARRFSEEPTELTPIQQKDCKRAVLGWTWLGCFIIYLSLVMTVHVTGSVDSVASLVSALALVASATMVDVWIVYFLGRTIYLVWAQGAVEYIDVWEQVIAPHR